MKRKVITITIVIALLILLIPLPIHYKDGGTIKYEALLYSVYDVHSYASLEDIENGKEYNEGIIIEILGIEVCNTVK